MRKVSLVGLLVFACSAAAVASAANGPVYGPHSEKKRIVGRIARGAFAPSRGGPWLIIVRRGKLSSEVKNGEGMSGSEVIKGLFTTRLRIGTSTLGAWRRRNGIVEGHLCGVTTVTVRPGKPIPFIRIHCHTGA
jgi:hypothetical protein